MHITDQEIFNRTATEEFLNQPIENEESNYNQEQEKRQVIKQRPVTVQDYSSHSAINLTK